MFERACDSAHADATAGIDVVVHLYIETRPVGADLVEGKLENFSNTPVYTITGTPSKQPWGRTLEIKHHCGDVLMLGL